ncbi:hypothetical protein Aperf_G00000124655 [Anoplocephala perfoliata]
MGRATRSSKTSKPAKTPQKGKTDPPDSELHSNTRRKSLRSNKKTPSPSTSKAPLNSTPTPASPVATRSSRTRLSTSREDHQEEQKATPQAGRGLKRRRTSLTALPNPEPPQNLIDSTSGSGRKQRGAQKEPSSSSISLLPSTPAAKRAKIAPPARTAVSTPVPSSKTRSATALKRKRKQESSSESDVNQSEQEEDERKSAHSQSSITSIRKRGAKRRRKASSKKPTPAKKPVAAALKKSTPSKTPSKMKKENVIAVNYESENGEKENREEEPIVKEEFVQPVKPKEPEPLPLTKKELEVLQRRQLLARLNHDDLSDLINSSNLLNNWPEKELRSPMAASSTALTIPASNRLWTFGEEAERTSTNPQLRHETVNGDVQDQAPRPTKESIVELETSSAKRAHRDISPENNGRAVGGEGGGKGETLSPVEVNSTAEQLPRLLDTFCVASFSISPQNDETVGNSAAEFNRLFGEVADIHPDVFCVKQLPGLSAVTRLKSELNSQGYQCSACTDAATQTVSFQSFIFFNRDVFTEVSTHRRSVQSMARKTTQCLRFISLVGQSAYPQLWRDTLIESMTPITETGDSDNQVQLLVAVLRHTATGSLLLFGCLTDRHQAIGGDPFRTPMPQSSSIRATNISIPHVTGDFSCCTPTVTVSVAGCHSSNSVIHSTEPSGPEWCPRSVGSRPDLAAIHAAGCIWALNDVWEEVKDSIQTPLVNGGFNGAPYSTTPEMRWILCANLEASPTSPVYQILRDGYPSDESITRLRAIRNVHLKDHDFFDATTLLDRLWQAFQHTCTDVCSCYQSVMGIEPPFTRYSIAPGSSSKDSSKKIAVSVEPRRCMDYIFCSGSSLQPREVLIPPCRATLAASDSFTPSGQGYEFIFSLAAKIVKIRWEEVSTAGSVSIFDGW